MNDLKAQTIRGGIAKLGAQGITIPLRMGSLMILARLLDPKDFGLVGMVTAFTGVLTFFKDFGLSTAAIQRSVVSDEQSSTLFWINVLVGGVLGLLLLAAAPYIAAFYREPRLLAVTAALAAGFVFNGAGVQHSVLLQRQMRFTTIAAIDLISLVLSIAIGIGMAMSGFGYWALVAMTVGVPAIATVCSWISTRWLPGRPHRQVGMRSMLRFGGTITLNGIVVYVGLNLDKILIGRFWGAAAVGLYGRAYQLIMLPTDAFNGAVGGVAFSALSRLQDDPVRLKTYFLKGYSLVLGLTIPVTVGCALLGNDLIFVILGPKWHDAADIFRILAPTILVLAMINPLGWLLFALGMVGRSLRVALVMAPVIIIGYVVGLQYGPKGVAIGYSTMMVLWVVPHIAWCVHGTVISLRDILGTVSRPLVSILLAAILVVGIQIFLDTSYPPLLRLVLEGTVLSSTYLALLMYVMGQRRFYVELWQGTRRGPLVEEV